jgi:uncharacterized hydrophobic protein (TIGR00271 family)
MAGEETPPAHEPRLRRLYALQDRVAAWFEISPATRTETVARMLRRAPHRAAGYWLQLLLATGIATLGLVLDSTAVVIGAMLISPLMAPLVELGMGLAIGSPFLVLRSAARTAMSVIVVVAASTLLTLLMPFHEITREVTARTSPTALDLGVAAFCALAAAYAVIRPGSDTASTAAGTAIGIALVPPLCVVGFGIGTGAAHIAGGAALLFTANICAILLLAVLSFLLLGYSRVRQRVLEEEELAKPDVSGVTVRLTRRLQSVFASGYGPILRVGMPLVLVVAVYVPLHSALAEVTWQIRVRAEINRVLGGLAPESVESSIKVERHQVAIRLVTVGSLADATRLKKSLEERVEKVANVRPTVQVIAVPDAESLRRLESTLTAPERAAAAPPARADVEVLRTRTGETLRDAWPTEAAGALRRWDLRLGPAGEVTIDVVHIGAALGRTGEALLGHTLSVALDADVIVHDHALSTAPVVAEADAGSGAPWLASAEALASALHDDPDLYLCIETPAAPMAGRDGGGPASALRSSPVFDDPRVRLSEGTRWSAQLSATACVAPARAPADAGAQAAGDAGPMDAGGGDAR